MKTIQEQNVFQFSSLFVAACLLVTAVAINFLDANEFIERLLFIMSSLIFLAFVYWFNGKIKNLNGFLSSYASTFVGYSFLVLFHVLVYLIHDNDLSINNYFGLVAIFLVYGYFFNLAISLIVYILYKAMLFFKQ